jgi:hypothetical protein
MHIIDTSITHSAENPMAMLEKFGNVKANQNPRRVTRGLDHRKSDLSDLRSVKVPKSGKPELGRSICFARRWIAGSSPAMTMQIRKST